MIINKIITLDCETTGLDFVSDEIIQVAAVKTLVDTREIVGSVNFYFESNREMVLSAKQITGYYTGKWGIEGKYPIARDIGARYLNKFLTEDSDSVIFCHNSPFDRAFCSNFLFKYGNIPHIEQSKYWFDSATLAVLFSLKSTWTSCSLDYCVEQLKYAHINRKKQHDALEDAYILQEVLFKLLDKISIK